MRNTNTLRDIVCPQCGNTDRFEVQVRAVATIIDNGAQDYTEPMWEDDAGTTCSQCGHVGDWHDFQDNKVLVPCSECGQTVRWNGRLWLDPDHRPQCGDKPHHSPYWLTLGELRDRTAHLPDAFPITVTQEDWYGNLHLDFVPENVDDSDGISLILHQTDDYDTRQW